MSLTTQTVELIEYTIYATSMVFLCMLLLHNISDMLIRGFGEDD